MPALCLPEYTRRGNTHTHTHARGYVLQAESGFIWPDSLRTRNSFSCKSSSRMFLRFRNERPTRQFLSFAMKRVSLSLSLYFVSRYHVQREQISGLLFPLKHVSDLMWRDSKTEDRDVETLNEKEVRIRDGMEENRWRVERRGDGEGRGAMVGGGREGSTRIKQRWWSIASVHAQ